MSVELRKEMPKEYKTVENIVREAFWNIYKPGCDEHFILHNFRNHPNYLEDLSMILTLDKQIIGQIMFSKAQVTHKISGQIKEICTFGPVAIHPDYQKLGYGEQLINAGIHTATAKGFQAIVIFGNPHYYHKFGFETASQKGIWLYDQQEEQIFDFVMVKELSENTFLSEDHGPWLYRNPEGYEVDGAAFEKYDGQFPYKEKEVNENQL